MLNLKEFLELNEQIGILYLEIRDFSNGGARLIEAYHIGSHATEDRKMEPRRWKTINKPINTLENVFKSGNAYWGIDTKAIPRRLLEMNVKHFSWSEGLGFTMNNGLWRLSQCTIWLDGNELAVKEMDLEEKLEKEKLNDLDEFGQLKGQLSFENLY